MGTDYKRRYDSIYAKLVEKAKKKNRIETRWINKFMNLTQLERAELLRKLSNKYSSMAYKNRCLNSKAHLSYPLYDLLYEYCMRYCVSVYPHSREGLMMTKHILLTRNSSSIFMKYLVLFQYILYVKLVIRKLYLSI